MQTSLFSSKPPRSLLTEGSSIRAVDLMDAHRDTVMRLGVRVAKVARCFTIALCATSRQPFGA